MAVVIITTFDLDDYVHGALKAGARGFLLKDAAPTCWCRWCALPQPVMR